MTQPPAPDWSTRLALSVAREVRRHRQNQGLSAQQLADRCAEIGMPIQRSVLANLESGRRTTVTIAEVFVLAYALGVPPGVLMFPVGHVQHAEVLPGAMIEPGSAVEWLAGRTFFDDDVAEDFFETPLGLIRLHQDAATALRRALQMRNQAVRELDRTVTEHEKGAQLFEMLSAEAEGIRRRLQAVADAADRKETYDFKEGERLSAEHTELMERVAHAQASAAALRYAQHKVASADAQVQSREGALREVREKIKSEGLLPPLLPRVLIYIDPLTTPYEDVPVKKDAPFYDGPERAMEGSSQVPEESMEEDQVGLFIAASEADKGRIREVLDELQPRLAETIAEAVDEAFRRREQEGK